MCGYSLLLAMRPVLATTNPLQQRPRKVVVELREYRAGMVFRSGRCHTRQCLPGKQGYVPLGRL